MVWGVGRRGLVERWGLRRLETSWRGYGAGVTWGARWIGRGDRETVVWASCGDLVCGVQSEVAGPQYRGPRHQLHTFPHILTPAPAPQTSPNAPQLDVKDLRSSASAAGSKVTGLLVLPHPTDDCLIVTSGDSR